MGGQLGENDPPQGDQFISGLCAGRGCRPLGLVARVEGLSFCRHLGVL